MLKIVVKPLLVALGLTLIAPTAGAQMGHFSSMDYGRQSFASHSISVAPSYTSQARRSSTVHPKMVLAARIAEAKAERRSTRLCWRYVKRALLNARVVPSYPSTVYAKQAARELTSRYGFVRLPVRNPYRAPVGSVLVYGGRGAGHVEIRTEHGFVSDYRSRHPSGLPFIGAYAKAS